MIYSNALCLFVFQKFIETTKKVSEPDFLNIMQGDPSAYDAWCEFAIGDDISVRQHHQESSSCIIC